MRNNIGYHTRLAGNNTVKVQGGSFGGSLDIETANRLVNSQFTVTVKDSGRAVFVDREGREVSLYISVDPEATEAGKAAIAAHRKAREEKAKAAREASNCEGAHAGGYTCSEIYNCCNCGGNGCGCGYCWSCNACETCKEDQ